MKKDTCGPAKEVRKWGLGIRKFRAFAWAGFTELLCQVFVDPVVARAPRAPLLCQILFKYLPLRSCEKGTADNGPRTAAMK